MAPGAAVPPPAPVAGVHRLGTDLLVPGAAPMMYFTVGGEAPQGAMAGEDAVPFDLCGVVAQQSEGRWIVTDGVSQILDFGSSEADALNAVTIIKGYAFTHQCFVGRPAAPMMYFRT